uniref:Structure-specific endonuclease subunit slx1 n=1 Tax=Anthurium amnicola TaxID=1678845 RepID=A0A1D1Z1B3_9ARAE
MMGRRRGGGGAAAAEGASWRRRGGRGTSPLWCVYLIVSSRLPRSYVGVTSDFPRRLKQHNGELKGGAKASCAGRPWMCACIVRGFKDKSEAFQFEARWKSISRRLPRKSKTDDNGVNKLLLHREAALRRVTDSLDGCHLHVDWMAGPP